MPWHLTVLNLLSQVGTLSPPLLLPIAVGRGPECRAEKLSPQGVGVGLNHQSCNEHSRALLSPIPLFLRASAPLVYHVSLEISTGDLADRGGNTIMRPRS